MASAGAISEVGHDFDFVRDVCRQCGKTGHQLHHERYTTGALGLCRPQSTRAVELLGGPADGTWLEPEFPGRELRIPVLGPRQALVSLDPSPPANTYTVERYLPCGPDAYMHESLLA